jgi:hypothetical protein
MFGGESTTGNKILTVLPLIISLIFVIISLATMPGTIGHKTKYVKKDDTNHELALKDIAIPVSLLSFTLLLLIIGIAINLTAVKKILKGTGN